MYYLNFATIIKLLKEFRRSGVLQAELPKGIANIQETCSIQVKILQGEITDYQLMVRSGGTIVADENMLREVERLGPLEWTFGPLKGQSTLQDGVPDNSLSPLSSSYTVPSSPSDELFLLVPRRLVASEQYSLHTLTRQQRRILSLVDGKRNGSQIATLLFGSSPSENKVAEFFTLLQDLEVLNIITLR